MLDRCPSDKCFLSHYPPATGDPGYQIPVLCKSHFDNGAQMPSFEARNFDIQVGPPLGEVRKLPVRMQHLQVVLMLSLKHDIETPCKRAMVLTSDLSGSRDDNNLGQPSAKHPD